ncbi:Hypothetical predicted protein [Podarcis lilfordi]|uniref:Uncharacterized protein n=1 Tax=Podarcis lilfordi TaxID=74358 RepID=A0AA35NVK2_9SAUR|nr:Hypothetical predicted protein [Podarcis lilfordi]
MKDKSHPRPHPKDQRRNRGATIVVRRCETNSLQRRISRPWRATHLRKKWVPFTARRDDRFPQACSASTETPQAEVENKARLARVQDSVSLSLPRGSPSFLSGHQDIACGKKLGISLSFGELLLCIASFAKQEVGKAPEFLGARPYECVSVWLHCISKRQFKTKGDGEQLLTQWSLQEPNGQT